MPYIPSSTLRGVARSAAFQEKIKSGSSRETAEQEVARYFGSLDAEPEDREGKVIFLNAYPLPEKSDRLPEKSGAAGGLTLDMANNIWKWEGDKLTYEPNPNIFFSLKEVTFKIALLPRPGCKGGKDACKQVANWLIAGLQVGAGSQINTGYGRLVRLKNKKIHELPVPDEFFRLNFALEGQLIHGNQKLKDSYQPYQKNKKTGEFKLNKKKQLQPNAHPSEEVRPVAFKSMLRYWFRTLALGVWDPSAVQTWEANLFGAIDPQQKRGMIGVHTVEMSVEDDGDDGDNNVQEGMLILAYSPSAPTEQRQTIKELFENLIWLMFRLGGIGQGARRPYYERDDEYLPVRGSTLYPENLLSKSKEEFCKIPEQVHEFKERFQSRLKRFYDKLRELSGDTSISPKSPKTVMQANAHQWAEAVDANCEIWVVSGKYQTNKPFALDVMNRYFHQLEKENMSNAKSLCGGDKIDMNNRQVKRSVTPSPVWICDLENYQVVTVFGITDDATKNPRKKYLEKLIGDGKSGGEAEQQAKIWRFS